MLNKEGFVPGTNDIPLHVKQYEILYEIGHGSFATVFQARDTKSNQSVALKFVSRELFDQSVNLVNFEKELRLFQRLDHPNITKYYETIFTDKYVIVAMELLTGGRLTNYVSSRSMEVRQSTLIRWVKEILEALNYIHSRGIVHRDIKPDNIVFDSHMTAKLVDFGLSTEVCQRRCTTPCGTPFYIAPEVILAKDYDGTKADIWSLGISLYTVVNKEFPFPEMTQKQYLNMIHKLDTLMRKGIDSPLNSIINRCLVVNPEERASASQLLTDPLFQYAEKPQHLRGKIPTALSFYKDKKSPVLIRQSPSTMDIRPNIIIPSLKQRFKTKTPVI